MKTYKGGCHCGEVQFFVQLPDINQGMRCDCSICARKGIVMTDTVVSPEDIVISDDNDRLTTYQFGTLAARHHFCSKCGIHTFVETRLNPGHYRINLGCIDELDALRLPETLYDGKSL